MLTDPAGPIAERFAGVGWIMIVLGGAVFLFVVGFLVVGIVRAPPRQARLTDNAWIVWGGIVVPLIVLVGLTGLATAVLAIGEGDADVEIEVTGYQYWWQARYAGEGVVTANELHIPTDRRVRLTLRSEDVIHSFWVPKLGGKIDMVPGQTTHLTLEADRPGTYRGQCAEFCGVQHANMALLVVAEDEESYQEWLVAMRAPAEEPVGALASRGLEVMETAACGACHTVRGTRADGRTAPDLTHVASRRTIAAATVANTRRNMEDWIDDPDTIKPGSLMPAVPLTAEERRAVLAYLEQLE